MEELTFEERIAKEINEDKEFWLNNMNLHLEKLLDKANMDKKLQRMMAIHCYTRNQVAKVRIKQLKAKLKETLISRKEKGELELLSYASMVS